jgi:hypothetical protein
VGAGIVDKLAELKIDFRGRKRCGTEMDAEAVFKRVTRIVKEISAGENVRNVEACRHALTGNNKVSKQGKETEKRRR